MSTENQFGSEPPGPTPETLEEAKQRLDRLWQSSMRIQKERTESSGADKRPERPREKSEREKNRELAEHLILDQGGVNIHTSISSELSPRGTSGFQDLVSDVKHEKILRNMAAGLVTSADIMKSVRPEDVMREHGVHEFIGIHQEVTPEYKTITTPGNKGILGIGRTPDRTEQVRTGREIPVMHSDIVLNGKNEPTTRISYYIPQSDWRDYSGRRGQMLSAEIFLPQSVTAQVVQILDQDPTAIRSIIARVMKEKLLINPEAWDKPQGNGDPLRPPYEQWDSEPGSHIYFQKDGMTPGFHPEAVRSAKYY